MSCLFCKKEIDFSSKFCNKSCAASYNNRKRLENGYSLKNKYKILNCLDCKVELTVNVNSRNSIRCKECAYAKILQSSKNVHLSCKDCEKEIVGCIDRQYCTECAKIRITIGARNSIKNQGDLRRSKNEIYFSKLCQEYFGYENIKLNFPMFDGWDADIIIETLQVAVMWNGKWHYEKITEKHSVAQVQNRDKIKIKKIMEYNYIPYTIKDMGSFDIEFVKREFNSMVEFLSHKQETTDRNR